MPLFEIAILQQPTKKEIEEGTGNEKLIFGPTSVLARDKDSAALNALLDNEGAIPKNVDRQRIQVLIRPFA